METIENFIHQFQKMGLYPPFHLLTGGVNEPECYIGGKRYYQFSSNNYLGLTQDDQVKKSAINSINKYGVGPGGSRVISGNVDIIEKLEKGIAELTDKEDCLTFPTGYMANIAVFKALMDPLFFNMPNKTEDGVIFSDEFNHGSIIDGCRLTKTEKIIFKHNDIDDLKKKLNEYKRRKNKLIVTEGVFSLDGEIIDLPAYATIADDYDAMLMIDDAHGVGILGEKGGGTVDRYKNSEGVDILMGCMDKAFGGTGGYLCGDKDLIDYLRIASRSSILSSALPTMMAGAMIKSLEIISTGNDLRKKLFARAEYLRNGLIKNNFKILGKDILPSIPLYIGDEELGIKFTNLMFEDGILCPLVRWPAVPDKQSRLRIIVMANHEEKHLDKFIEVATKAAKEVSLI